MNTNTLKTTESKPKNMRLAALYRFATAISLLTIIGHLWLGFEQSYAVVAVSLLTGYSVEFILEWFAAKSEDRRPWYLGGMRSCIEFLLPAHIGSLAVAMLLYSNETLLPVAFASAMAVSSKYLFRVVVNGRTKHFLNPSNTGISITLILFSWVGIAPPYQFTENLDGMFNWLLPLFFIVVGSFLNYRFTRRIPLILAWLVGFAAQAIIRAWFFDASLLTGLLPMTGIAFLLFTFYMISDPGTTPYSIRGQIAFGASVATVYGILMLQHVVFGLFFSLVIVCALRGSWLMLNNRRTNRLNVLNPISVNG